MVRFVRNATSRDYTLTGEINTVNGKQPINIRIIKGGIYEVDTHINYVNLESALNAGDLVPAYENKSTVAKKVARPDIPIKVAPVEVEVTEPETETAEEPDNPAEEDLTEESEVAETTNPEVDTEVADSTPVEVPDQAPFICPHCGGEYASKKNLIRHIELKHGNPEQ